MDDNGDISLPPAASISTEPQKHTTVHMPPLGQIGIYCVQCIKDRYPLRNLIVHNSHHSWYHDRMINKLFKTIF